MKKVLTAQQVAFFNVFGYLVLPQAFDAGEVETLSRDFDDKALSDRDGDKFDSEQRQDIDLGNVGSWENLGVSDNLFYPLEQLLGEDFITKSSPNGGLYVGDTQWHPDIPTVTSQTHIKAGVYLDPVRNDTGCLRVVPGSHKNPLHDLLQPLRMGRIKESLDNGTLMSNIGAAGEKDRKEMEDWAERTGMNLDDGNTVYGVDPLEIPSAPLESNPGDVAFFHQCIFHASFGGDVRRMVSLTWASSPTESGHTDGVSASNIRSQLGY